MSAIHGWPLLQTYLIHVEGSSVLRSFAKIQNMIMICEGKCPTHAHEMLDSNLSSGPWAIANCAVVAHQLFFSIRRLFMATLGAL